MERLTLRDDDGRALLTPYGLRMYCSTQATADCICKLEEALQAQEPRVMTLEEWKNLPDPDDGTCLCYEIKDCGLRSMLIKMFDRSVHLYGKAFRCWTSRPDEKVRAETPWEA